MFNDLKDVYAKIDNCRVLDVDALMEYPYLYSLACSGDIVLRMVDALLLLDRYEVSAWLYNNYHDYGDISWTTIDKNGATQQVAIIMESEGLLLYIKGNTECIFTITACGDTDMVITVPSKYKLRESSVLILAALGLPRYLDKITKPSPTLDLLRSIDTKYGINTNGGYIVDYLGVYINTTNGSVIDESDLVRLDMGSEDFVTIDEFLPNVKFTDLNK